MSLLSCYAIGIAIACFIWFRRERKRKRIIQYEYDAYIDALNEKYDNRQKRTGIVLDRYSPPKQLKGTGQYGILLSAFRSLEKQHAAGYRSWISSCIERMQKGLDVPPEIALRALYMTREELNGRRYNLDGLNEAIVTLETQMGEWE